VDLLIQFEFDSSRLKPDSKPILDALVSALKNDKLKDTPFLIVKIYNINNNTFLECVPYFKNRFITI
jgi:hypothetical protein